MTPREVLKNTVADLAAQLSIENIGREELEYYLNRIRVLHAQCEPGEMEPMFDQPTIRLREDIVLDLAGLVEQIWIDDCDMASCISGWFARAGVSEVSTKEVIKAASPKEQLSRRLHDVEETYRNLNIKPIQGRRYLEEIFAERHLGEELRRAYGKLLKSINARLPRRKSLPQESSTKEGCCESMRLLMELLRKDHSCRKRR